MLCVVTVVHEKGVRKALAFKRKDILRNTQYIHVAQHIEPRHKEKYKVGRVLVKQRRIEKIELCDPGRQSPSSFSGSNEPSCYIKCEDFLD